MHQLDGFVTPTSWCAVRLNFSVCLAKRIFFNTYLSGTKSREWTTISVKFSGFHFQQFNVEILKTPRAFSFSSYQFYKLKIHLQSFMRTKTEGIRGAKSVLLLFLGLVENEKGSAKCSSANLLYHLIVFHLRLGLTIIGLHGKLRKL